MGQSWVNLAMGETRVMLTTPNVNGTRAPVVASVWQVIKTLVLIKDVQGFQVIFNLVNILSELVGRTIFVICDWPLIGHKSEMRIQIEKKSLLVKGKSNYSTAALHVPFPHLHFCKFVDWKAKLLHNNYSL